MRLRRRSMSGNGRIEHVTAILAHMKKNKDGPETGPPQVIERRFRLFRDEQLFRDALTSGLEAVEVHARSHAGAVVAQTIPAHHM
jgi:hypothetical protein